MSKWTCEVLDIGPKGVIQGILGNNSMHLQNITYHKNCHKKHYENLSKIKESVVYTYLIFKYDFLDDFCDIFKCIELRPRSGLDGGHMSFGKKSSALSSNHSWVVDPVCAGAPSLRFDKSSKIEKE